MNIVIVNDTFVIGGAEVYSARLAQALFEAGHRVWLYSIHNGRHIDHNLLLHNAPDVPLVTMDTPFDSIIQKATSAIKPYRKDFDIREQLVIRHLSKFIKNNNIEVAHAHMFISDYIISKVKRKGLKFARVASMHGTHEGFLYNYIHKEGWVIPNYPAKLNRCLAGLNGIVYGTKRNVLFLADKLVDQHIAEKIIVRKIYNGYKQQRIHGEVTRGSLGIPSNDIVFMMIARGVAAKGWPWVLEAFKNLNAANVHLVLIGDSDYVQQLKHENKEQQNIHFVGFQDHTNEWISIANVGLLPSIFGESVPTAVVEFLCQGRPVIVTNVAECANMITVGNKTAGYVISVPINEDGFVDAGYTVDEQKLQRLMRTYIDNYNILTEQSKIALLAFEQFNMELCVKLHVKLYEECLVQERLTATQ